MRHRVLIIPVGVLLGGLLAYAASKPDAPEPEPDISGQLCSQVKGLTPGKVVKVDRAQGRLTLKHGSVAHLNMPAMTMPFAVADPAFLAQAREGGNVRFALEDRQGVLTITRLDLLP